MGVSIGNLSSLPIDKRLRKRFKDLCGKLNVSMKHTAEDLIKEWLRKNGEERDERIRVVQSKWKEEAENDFKEKEEDYI
jgi:CRISPR/Cas system-associated protein Csx1